MHITKFEHSCLQVAVDGSNLVIDPGGFLAARDFDDVVAVVITHEHPDHIHESIPIIDNVGVLVNDTLYYGGDSYDRPDEPVEVLAAPIGAPWLKISEAMDYVLAVRPKLAFYVHDVPLSPAGIALAGPRLQWAVEQGGGRYVPLAPGESLDA